MNSSDGCQRSCCQATEMARAIIDDVAAHTQIVNEMPVAQVVADYAFRKLVVRYTNMSRPSTSVERTLPPRQLIQRSSDR